MKILLLKNHFVTSLYFLIVKLIVLEMLAKELSFGHKLKFSNSLYLSDLMLYTFDISNLDQLR